MNLHQGRNSWVELAVAIAVIAFVATGWVRDARAQGGKGYDTEFGFTFAPVKAKGLVAPVYVQEQSEGKVVVSDLGAGQVFSVGVEGGAAKPSGKLKKVAGVAIGPAGFGSYAGIIFALAPEGGDVKAPCAVYRFDQSGAAAVFAKLPDAGSLGGGKATDCRDLEFGAAGSPYAGKLYALTNGNAAIYEIDASGKARAFGVFDKPVAFEVNNLGFTSPTDSKAPNAMLLSARPRMETAAKVGRIAIVGRDGKLGGDPYLVGFIRPTGFAFAPSGFASYGRVLFIADAGRLASENAGEHDGRIYRVFKGVAREYATGMVDPSALKFVGNTMVICDPAAHGKPGSGALLTIAPMY
ncbi:MAG: hypothetical protein WA005_05560 [Candidatus Binataceae bacterium]